MQAFNHHSATTLPLVSAKQQFGANYEALAGQFLQSQGLQLLYKNWLKPKVGELDLVMIEPGDAWDVLVFVEVRFRQCSDYGDAIASVTKTKQNRLVKTARYFLQSHPQYQDYECRFDILGFVLPSTQVNLTQVNQGYQQSKLTSENVAITAELGTDMPFEWIKGAFITSAW